MPVCASSVCVSAGFSYTSFFFMKITWTNSSGNSAS